MTAAIVTAPSLASLGFAHGFSARPLDLGLDTATADHAALAALVGYDPARLRVCRQVHGAELLDDLAPAVCAAREADALIARRGGDAVGVRVADCVPVLLGSPRTGHVAAVHAGWRGVVAGVVARAAGALGATDLVAAVGPFIGPCCFEVGEEVAARFAPEQVLRGPGPRPHVDLGRAVRAQLAAAGVAGVEAVGGCTVCDPRWHSFRRDGAASGRMLAVIRATDGA